MTQSNREQVAVMCGRFTLRSNLRKVSEALGVLGAEDSPPRYNIAPTQDICIIRSDNQAAGRELASVQWGLIPSWSKDVKIGHSLINARCETIATKPAFRSAMKRRRCLIPADGFYEWKKLGKQKQPFLIELVGSEPFAFAGLWERWNSLAGPIESCAILTTVANNLILPLHDRMPVILQPIDYAVWLDTNRDCEGLKYLFDPYPDTEMTLRPASSWVNSPRHEGPQCLDEAAALF